MVGVVDEVEVVVGVGVGVAVVVVVEVVVEVEVVVVVEVEVGVVVVNKKSRPQRGGFFMSFYRHLGAVSGPKYQNKDT